MPLYYPSGDDLTQIRRATDKALLSDHRCRHGAVIKKGSRIVAGRNKVKNHPSITEEKCSVHAECDALRNHPAPRRGICYSIRINRKNQIDMAKPCNNCTNALIKAGIKRVIFSDPSSPSNFKLMTL